MFQTDAVPNCEDCVLRNLLDKYADQTPDKPFLVTEDGSETSYQSVRTSVRTIAAALQAQGIKQGDPVVVWLPNGPECLKIWFAINYIGAVYVPINTSYRGGILEHVLQNADAKLMIAHGQLADRLSGVDTATLETLVIVTGPLPEIDGLQVLPANALSSKALVTDPARPIEPWDTQSIIYTSGTTGPSKGVCSSYAHLYAMSSTLTCNTDVVPYIGDDDRFMVNLPLFHVGGTAPTYGMLIKGAGVVMLDAFDTATFWQTVNRTKTTCVILLGVMATFLMKQAVAPNERETTLNHAIIIPLSAEGIAFRERFNVTVHSLFNMSEVSCPLVTDENPTVPGACGRPRKGVQLRLLDAFDREVPQGEIGELVIRTDAPWALNHGYNANPKATAEAWRNGWFHTGDAFRIDAAGDYFFVDRFKDSIRRRGENVSSFEVEAEVCAHPAIREAAAVAVPSEFGEDDILVAVSLVDDLSLDAANLLQFLIPRMAHFMVPRYIRVMDDLPKTPTNKVEKYLIRNDGITTDCWDRETAGIKIKREKLG